MGGLLADRAGGVILLRERVAVGQEWLSRCGSRGTLRIGDRDRPADVHVRPRRWRPAWEGRRAPSPQSGLGRGVPQRPGAWLTFLPRLSRRLAGVPRCLWRQPSVTQGCHQYFSGMVSRSLMYGSLCPVPLAELLGFIWILPRLPAFGEV